MIATHSRSRTEDTPVTWRLDPLVDTGRGSWAFYRSTTLQKLLDSYDHAYPEYTDTPREAVIASWEGAKRWVESAESAR